MTQPALAARVYGSLSSLATLQPAWEELLSKFPAATIFSTADWLLPWWRAFGADQQLKVLGFFDSTQRLVALAPLSLSTHRAAGGMKLNLLRLMGDGSFDSDNLDMPVLPGYESAFADALLDYLETDALAWDFCQLNTLPGDSAAGCALASGLEGRQWPHFSSQRPWAVIHLPSSWEAYLQQLASENRNNLERYWRRLQRRYRVDIRKCTSERDLPDCLESLFCLHQKRWLLRGEPGTFASSVRREFYYDLSRTLLARGRLEFWLLDLDGKTVAAQFCFRYGDTVFLLQEGFDPDHAADRVGFVLRGHVLRQLIEGGVRHYDFLFGESPGKNRWAPQLQHYRDIHFAKPFGKGSLYLKLSHRAADSKESLRAHLPRVFAFLHRMNIRLRGIRDPERATPQKKIPE